MVNLVWRQGLLNSWTTPKALEPMCGFAVARILPDSGMIISIRWVPGNPWDPVQKSNSVSVIVIKVNKVVYTNVIMDIIATKVWIPVDESAPHPSAPHPCRHWLE